VTLLQMLALLEPFDLAAFRPVSVEAAHLFAQAGRLAFADRALYLADSDFVPVPLKALLDPDYLRQRARLITPQHDMGVAAAGQLSPLTQAEDRSPELPSTSHFSIIDRDGNAVSMTSSIETAFGSTLMVDGFLLNNQMTDFSFLPEQNGQPVANRIAGGKRPRSSMTPAMVFDEQGQLQVDPRLAGWRTHHPLRGPEPDRTDRLAARSATHRRSAALPESQRPHRTGGRHRRRHAARTIGSTGPSGRCARPQQWNSSDRTQPGRADWRRRFTP
jgi:hypothetical protein